MNHDEITRAMRAELALALGLLVWPSGAAGWSSMIDRVRNLRETQAMLHAALDERDEAWRQRDEAIRERDETRRRADLTVADLDETLLGRLATLAAERDAAWRARDEARRERDEARAERDEARCERDEARVSLHEEAICEVGVGHVEDPVSDRELIWRLLRLLQQRSGVRDHIPVRGKDVRGAMARILSRDVVAMRVEWSPAEVEP